jgi:hypothetical protein
MSPLLGSTGLVSYYSYRGNIDTLPDVFSIGADVTDVEIDAEITRTTTITGINYKAKVTPSSGATISVNGSGYTSTAQYVKNNQSISIKFTPTDYETTYTVSLTVGKRSDAYTILTRNRPEDGVPNAFSFTDQPDVDPPFRTNVESNVITLSGMSNVPSGQTPRTNDIGTASISGNSAQFKVIRDGAVVRVYGTGNFSVINGDQIQLRMNAGGNAQTVSTTFSVTGTDTTNLASPVTSTVSDTWSITSRTYTATITLSASPGTVDYNTASTISWISQNISGPINITNIGNVNDASGSRSTGNLNGGASGGSRSFTATANTLYSPPATVTSNTVTVNINPPPAPSVSLSSGSNSIAYNSSTTLSWSSSNATSVNSSTDNFAGSNLSGSNVSTGNLTQSKTYTIRVNGVEGQVSSPSSVTINVAAPPVPTVSLTADSNSIAFNSSTTLRWSSSNATSVNSSTDNFAGSSTSGSVSTGNLTQPKTYTIVLNGLEGQTATSSVTITVPEEPEIVKYITSNTTNADAQSYFGSTDWTRSVRKRLIVNGGVVVGSTNPSAAALSITAGVVGAFVLENNGSIQGAGGLGGVANGGNGGKGGNAIIINNKGTGGTVSITNNGSIYAGGGGGGAGTKGGTGGQGGSGSYQVNNPTQYFQEDAGCNLAWGQWTCGGNFVALANYNNAGCVAAPYGRTITCNRFGFADNSTGNGVYLTQDNYSTVDTTGGNGGEGGNGGNGGVGQGYAQSAAGGAAGSGGAAGAAGGTNAGSGGNGGTGGTGGTGGGLGADGSNGSQGNTGDTGASGNVGSGSGGLAGGLPVGIRGLAGYYINGIDNLNGGVGGTVGGRTKNIGEQATTN